MRRYMEVVGALLGLAVALAGFSAGASALDLATALKERALGNADAPVTIVDYSSLTCPHCADFHIKTLPKLKTTYIDTGKVKLVMREFVFDQWGLKATMLARCAPEERYFALLDVLFKEQPHWAMTADKAAALSRIGKLAGMSQETIDACWADQKLADGILAMTLEGQNQAHIQATPTFVLNGGAERIEGAQPFESFAKAIDRLVK